jgi:hypothetical protein
MGPAVGRGEHLSSLSAHESHPHHRYNTRSNGDGFASHAPLPEARYSSTTDTAACTRTGNDNTQNTTPTLLTQRLPLPVSERVSTDDDQTQEMDITLSDGMMDQVTYSTSNPLKAPFPSPAMKTSQPFYPFPPQQRTPLQEGWVTPQGIVNGQGILVEAANRAQMAILVDDMGTMGFEQIEQA